MIDIKKLEEANELLKKLEDYTFEAQFGSKHGPKYLIREIARDVCPLGPFDLDGLIFNLNKLIYLSQKPKFKMGDPVWYINDDWEPEFLKVLRMDNEYGCYTYYGDGKKKFHEDSLYGSRDELIDDMIKHWEGFRIVNKKETYVPPKTEEYIHTHVSDGKLYGNMEWGSAGNLKCVLCGQLYDIE